MNPAHFRSGASGPLGRLGSLFCPCFGRGFTLLEMCMVLFIIALLFGVTMPAMQSAFVEQGVRRDAHQLALLVKTAMIQSAEQHRAYTIDLTATTMSLHPAGEAAREVADGTASDAGDDAVPGPVSEDVNAFDQLDAANRLLAPDPKKNNAWVDMPQTEWTFEPGELCPAFRVRVSRGKAWVEMSFGALTGDVENETSYVP